METMATVIQHRTEAEYSRKEVAIDLCDTLFIAHAVQGVNDLTKVDTGKMV